MAGSSLIQIVSLIVWPLIFSGKAFSLFSISESVINLKISILTISSTNEEYL